LEGLGEVGGGGDADHFGGHRGGTLEDLEVWRFGGEVGKSVATSQLFELEMW
jgi:hypothetical protein